MIKGILFDKDGTLIDFHQVWGTAAAAVVQRLCSARKIEDRQQELLETLGVCKDAVDPEGALAWKSYRGIAEDLAPLLWTEEKPEGEAPELLESELSRLFYEEVGEKRREYPVFTDIKRMMEEMDDEKICIGLATTDEMKSAKACMEVLKAAEYISFWGVSGTELPEKPDGRLISLAAKKWKIRPDEIAMVGDTPNDMRFAHNGGALAVAVLSGTGSEEALRPLADKILDSVADLSAFVRSVNQKEEENGAH